MNNRSEVEAEIRTQLQQTLDFLEQRGRDSAERFVMDHGVFFSRPSRTSVPGYRRRKACFGNCLLLALVERFTYVEGFALSAAGHAIHHGWCVDHEGDVIDPTWKDAGSAYFGVPFDGGYLRERFKAQHKAFGAIGSLLTAGDDDYRLVRGTETREWRVRRVAAHEGSAATLTDTDRTAPR